MRFIGYEWHVIYIHIALRTSVALYSLAASAYLRFSVFALEWFALIHRENILLDATVVSVRQHDVNVLFDGIWTSWDTLHTGDRWVAINKLRPRQNGRHFADDISKYIFLYENARISLKISMKFVPNVRINNIPALAQIMAWRRPGDKPLSEPMVVSLLTHICATRPQWVNQMRCGDAYMPQRICTVIVLASNGDKPLPSEQWRFVKWSLRYTYERISYRNTRVFFHRNKPRWKCSLLGVAYFAYEMPVWYLCDLSLLSWIARISSDCFLWRQKPV